MEQGQEPPFFTCHFGGWDTAKLASIPDVYADKVNALALEKEKAMAA